MTKSFISEEISCIVPKYNCSLQSFVHWFCLLIFHAKSLLSILSIHFTATGLSAFNCKKPWHFLSILLSNACRSDNSFDSTYRLLAFKCSKTQIFSFDSRDCFFFGGWFQNPCSTLGWRQLLKPKNWIDLFWSKPLFSLQDWRIFDYFVENIQFFSMKNLFCRMQMIPESSGWKTSTNNDLERVR